MEKLRNILLQLLSAQKQLDYAIEMLPDMPEVTSLMMARRKIRDYFDSDVLPKWVRLSSLLGIDSNISEGVRYLSDFESNIALNILSNNLYGAAYHSLEREEKLSQIAARLFRKKENAKKDHPMSGFPTKASFAGRLSRAERGLGGFMDWFSGEKVTDLIRGQTAFSFYYNRANSYEESGLPNTFEAFLSYLNQKSPSLIDGVGGTINSIDKDIGYTDSQVQTFMEKIADQGAGKLPLNLGVFQQGIGKDAADPSFWTSIKFTTSETAAQITDGLSTGLTEVGQGLISTLNLSTKILKYLPVVLIGSAAVAVWYYMPKKRF